MNNDHNIPSSPLVCTSKLKKKSLNNLIVNSEGSPLLSKVIEIPKSAKLESPILRLVIDEEDEPLPESEKLIKEEEEKKSILTIKKKITSENKINDEAYAEKKNLVIKQENKVEINIDDDEDDDEEDIGKLMSPNTRNLLQKKNEDEYEGEGEKLLKIQKANIEESQKKEEMKKSQLEKSAKIENETLKKVGIALINEEEFNKNIIINPEIPILFPKIKETTARKPDQMEEILQSVEKYKNDNEVVVPMSNSKEEIKKNENCEQKNNIYMVQPIMPLQENLKKNEENNRNIVPIIALQQQENVTKTEDNKNIIAVMPLEQTKNSLQKNVLQPLQVELKIDFSPKSSSPSPSSQRKTLYSPKMKKKRILEADQINLKELETKKFEPNVEELEAELSKKHARDSNNKGFSFMNACCLDTGYHFCGSTSTNVEMNQFGIGITLYFKFLKYIILFFLLFCIFSIPSITLSLLASKNTDLKFDSFTKYLFGTTLGTIGYSNYLCSQSDTSTNSKIFQPKNKILHLQCLTGTIDIRNTTSKFGLNLITNNSMNLGCREVNEEDLDLECIDQDNFKKQLTNICNDKNNCSIELKNNFFKSNCNKNLTNYNFFVSALCKDTKIFFYTKLNDVPISTSIAALIIGECDTLISICFFIMLLLLKKSQKKAVHNLLMESLTPSQFSIEVANLPNSLEKEEMMMKLKNHFEKYMAKKASINAIDIHVSEGGDVIAKAMKKEKLSKKRNSLIKNLIQNYFSNPQTTLPEKVSVEELEEMVNNIEDEKVHIKAKKLVAKIAKIELDIIDLQNNLYKTNKKKSLAPISWMTFETIPQRNRVYKEFSSSSLDRFCLNCFSCCIMSEKKFEKKHLIINDAPDPSNINWENMNYKFFSLTWRRLISILSTFLLIFLCFIGIAFIKLQKDDYIQKHPAVNCDNFIHITEKDVANEYKSSQKLGYIECYCNEDITNKINQKFEDANNTQICLLWLNEYLLNQALPYIIVFLIIFINIVMQVFFKVLSTFEKHKYVSVEMGARVLKIFIAQFLNTGMLLLIVNIRFKYDSNSSLVSGIKIIVNGKFDDLTPDWFNDVGSVIALTLIANVFTSPVTYIVFFVIKKMKILWDQRCTCKKSISRKKSAAAYSNLYQGPHFMVDFRYAQIVSIIYVCMIYAGGIPILYFSTCAQLFIFYWFDKIFLLKYYRKPKNFDEKLESYVVKLLFVALLLHIAFSVWIFGNEKIFNDTFIINSINNYVNMAEQQIGNNLKADFLSSVQKRILKTQCLTLDITFILIVIYCIYRVFLVFWFQKLFLLIKKTDTQTAHSPTKKKLLDLNYFQVLTTDQIEKEIIYIQLTFFEKQNKIHPLYSDFLKERIKKLKYQKKITEGKYHFIDMHSYDYRNVPAYNEFCDIENLQKKRFKK